MSSEDKKYRQTIRRQSELYYDSLGIQSKVDDTPEKDVSEVLEWAAAAHLLLEEFVKNGGELGTLSDEDFLNLLEGVSPVVIDETETI